MFLVAYLYNLWNSVPAAALMSGLNANAPKYRPLNEVDREILHKEPWLNPDTAGTVRKIYNHAYKPDDNWRVRGWVEFKGIIEHSLAVNGKTGGSLRLMARALCKSTRMVARYCAAGLIPFAEKPKGGQWRIRYRKYNKAIYLRMLRKLEKDMRQSKRLTEAIELYRGIVHTETERAWNAYNLYLASGIDGALLPEDVQTPEQKQQHGIGVAPPPISIWGAIDKEKKRALLVVAVQRLGMKGIAPTAASAAAELGISRRTLYRHYSASDLAGALRTYNHGATPPSSSKPSAPRRKGK